jgi:hypothetical protein
MVRSKFGISYDPATLKVMTEAFDAAWQDIAGNYSGRFSDDRRTSLAKIIFRLADQGLTDGARIKENALQPMARRERAVPFARLSHAPADRAAQNSRDHLCYQVSMAIYTGIVINVDHNWRCLEVRGHVSVRYHKSRQSQGKVTF